MFITRGLLWHLNSDIPDLQKRLKIFELSRKMYSEAIIFALTSGSEVMKMNHELGFEPVTYSELTTDELFWEGCKSCIDCPILMSKQKKTVCALPCSMIRKLKAFLVKNINFSYKITYKLF